MAATTSELVTEPLCKSGDCAENGLFFLLNKLQENVAITKKFNFIGAD